jgi:hypothetical protein
VNVRKSVNRGEGTNSWNIPKFIDLLLLPQYMSRLGSTGRFHVGFAERAEELGEEAYHLKKGAAVF